MKLPNLQAKVQSRQELASIYDQRLAKTGFVLPNRQVGKEHAMHLYVIQTEKREELENYLKQNDVGTAVHYPQPVHQQPAYLGRLHRADRLPVTEMLAPKILSLPIFPQMSLADVNRVCDLLMEWDRQNK